MSDERPYCALCLYALSLPTVYVKASQGEPLHYAHANGWPIIRAAAAAVDRDGSILINENSQVGVYAITTVHGTAVCLGHVHEALYNLQATTRR